MKKIFTIIAGLLITAPVTAQYSYFKAGVGYHFPSMRQEMALSNFSQKEGSFDYEESIARYSMHRGITPLISFGHMFNKYVGFEIGADYLIATQNKALQTARIGGDIVYNKLTTKASNINFFPALRLSVPLNKSISMYSRTGLVIPLVSVIKERFTADGYDTAGNFRKLDINTEIKNRFTIGFAGAIGFEIKVSEKVFFFTEASAQLLNVWSKSGKVTEYEINGKSQLGSLQTYQKETLFKKAISTTSNTGQFSSKPSESLTYQSAFHSVGVNIGLSFRL